MTETPARRPWFLWAHAALRAICMVLLVISAGWLIHDTLVHDAHVGKAGGAMQIAILLSFHVVILGRLVNALVVGTKQAAPSWRERAVTSCLDLLGSLLAVLGWSWLILPPGQVVECNTGDCAAHPDGPDSGGYGRVVAAWMLLTVACLSALSALEFVVEWCWFTKKIPTPASVSTPLPLVERTVGRKEAPPPYTA